MESASLYENMWSPLFFLKKQPHLFYQPLYFYEKNLNLSPDSPQTPPDLKLGK